MSYNLFEKRITELGGGILKKQDPNLNFSDKEKKERGIENIIKTFSGKGFRLKMFFSLNGKIRKIINEEKMLKIQKEIGLSKTDSEIKEITKYLLSHTLSAEDKEGYPLSLRIYSIKDFKGDNLYELEFFY